MQQINNGFCDYYYLSESGKVYNKNTDRQMKLTDHSYYLKTIDGRFRKVSLKKLYRLVYDKIFCIDEIESLENEEWKEVDNTNGIYFISNRGRVKSKFGYKAKILKPTLTKNGYHRLDIIVEGMRQTKLVHRLVADAFLLPPKSIDYEIHHKDFVRTNNDVDNLEWVTPAQHKLKHQQKKRSE